MQLARAMANKATFSDEFKKKVNESWQSFFNAKNELISVDEKLPVASKE